MLASQSDTHFQLGATVTYFYLVMEYKVLPGAGPYAAGESIEFGDGECEVST